MDCNKKILITGAAGNLGNLLANYLKDSDLRLNLMVHKKDIDGSLKERANIEIFKVDLGKKETLGSALKNVDVVVHFAGILFKCNPEKFLPTTNTLYFKNLLDIAIEEKVKRVILISFPHVEGETTVNNPAKGRLDGCPVSVHAQTRLDEEKYLFEKAAAGGFEAVSLRVGMVYGKGILMIDAARWLSRYWLLGIWKKATWIHLISKDDFLEAAKNAVIKDHISGIYHIGDDGVQTLQEFLDIATGHWGYKKPWRLPLSVINLAAGICELFSWLFNTKSPLTCDFIKIATISYYGETSRMKKDLLPNLKYKNFLEGINIL